MILTHALEKEVQVLETIDQQDSTAPHHRHVRLAQTCRVIHGGGYQPDIVGTVVQDGILRLAHVHLGIVCYHHTLRLTSGASGEQDFLQHVFCREIIDHSLTGLQHVDSQAKGGKRMWPRIMRVACISSAISLTRLSGASFSTGTCTHLAKWMA